MKYIIFLLVVGVCGCLCVDPLYLEPTTSTTMEKSSTTNPTTSTTIKYHIRYIDTNVTNIINITKIINETKYLIENVTINLTDIQKSDIINLKPNVCHNIGCSEGFIKAKYEVMNILNMPTPKFSERPGIGFDPFNRQRWNESTVTFPIRNDNFTDYFLLNTSFWYVNHPINDSIYNLNVSFVWNYTYLYNVSNGNKTAYFNKTFFHRFNMSTTDIFNRDHLYVRRGET